MTLHLTVGVGAVSSAADRPIAERVDQAVRILSGAEERFRRPSADWFNEAQAELREESALVSQWLQAQGDPYADAWKAHLRWELLEANLRSSDIQLDQLQLVRRWLYSNREGLEGPWFANLRSRTDAFLDAAVTRSYENLELEYRQQLATARRQLHALARDPSDAHAADLGRTLGWLEQTGQLPDELAKVRDLVSLPNAQVIVSADLIDRILDVFERHVDQSVNISDVEQSPPSGVFRRQRMLRIRGVAHSSGTTALQVVPSNQFAHLNLMFRGQVEANCTADAGPAVLHIRTQGPVQAAKPIYVGPAGISVGNTRVDSHVTSQLVGVTAGNGFVRRIAQRRAGEPSARARMKAAGHERATQMLVENVDERVEEALAEIRAEAARMRQSMGRLGDVLAPLAREGAQPALHSIRSAPDAVLINGLAGRRNQLGAATAFDEAMSPGGDVQIRIHLSMFNNMLETILGGKELSDTFLMRYAKILQAELPLELMVHSRAPRWAITTEKHRPLEVHNPSPNQLELTMRVTSVTIDGEKYEGAATAVVAYALIENDFAEYELVRRGEVQLDTELTTIPRMFLHEKLQAFFAPLLNAGGVAVPDGDVIGAFNDYELVAVRADGDWIAAGINIPSQFFAALLRREAVD